MAKIKFDPDTRPWQVKLNEVWAKREPRDWVDMCRLAVTPEQWKAWELAMQRPISRTEIINMLTEIFSGNVEIRLK